MTEAVTLDQSQAVRSGEELDNPKLYDFLQTHLAQPDLATDAGVPFLVEQFPNGYSNLTYRVRFGNRDMVLRRPPFGANIKAGHDMEREYKVLHSLATIYARVPRPLIYSDDLTVLGAPFYLMERVEGVILRSRPDSSPLLSAPTMAQLSKAFIENLADIHALDYAATELKKLARPGSHVERQVNGWIQRYTRAKTDELPAIEKVESWLTENKPADCGTCLIHNDYKYDNLILAARDLAQVVAVLDWEMATIGDPLMDLGPTLAYWVDPNDSEELKAIYPATTLWPGNLDRAQLTQHYAVYSGREVGNIVFYYVYGLFKNAVIAQQIYARYKQGFTSDERFGRLAQAVRVLANTAVRAIEKNRIDQLG